MIFKNNTCFYIVFFFLIQLLFVPKAKSQLTFYDSATLNQTRLNDIVSYLGYTDLRCLPNSNPSWENVIIRYSISFLPNPVKNGYVKFRIEKGTPISGQLTFYNIYGAKVHQINSITINGHKGIQIPDFLDGIFMIQFLTISGQTFKGKLLIK